MPLDCDVNAPMASPIFGSKPYSAVQTGASITPSALMNSWTWISPTPASLDVDAVQPCLQRLPSLLGVAAAEVVQHQADRPAERVAAEEAVEAVARADPEERAAQVVDRAVEPARAAEVEVDLIALGRAVEAERLLEPVQ